MKGISTRTTKLGFNILRLHYSADPDKDPSTPKGKRWLEEAKRGMSEARWRQEHEIDYGALGGQLVFPGFDESIHVVPHGIPLDPRHSTAWLACDPHPRTAHAFVWLAVNKEGEHAVVWSWWPQERHEREGMVVRDYVDGLRDIENAKMKVGGADVPLFPASYIELMDVAGKTFNATEEQSYFDRYREYGVHFRPAKKNRDLSGYDLINEKLACLPHTVGNKIEQRPLLTIWAGCGDNDVLVHQMKSLRYREWKGVVTDKDAPEEPQQKERHLIDCLSYILLDGPRFIDRDGGYQDLGDDPNVPRAHGGAHFGLTTQP